MTLQANVETLATRVATEIKSVRTQFAGNASGSLAGLTTTDKTSLLAAINELDAAVEALASAEGGATIVDGAPSGASVWSSSKTNTEIGAQIVAATNALVASAPGLLDTLDELAAALGDDPNFATTITGLLAAKAPLVSPALTGVPTAPTAAGGTSTTQIATTAFVAAASPAASDTVVGRVELATVLEATTGTDTSRAVTPAGVKAVGDLKAPLSHTHTASQITDFASAADSRINTVVVAATESLAGKVELATAVETTTGTDSTRAVHPAGLKVELDKKAQLSHTHTASQITDFATAADARVNAVVVAASETVAGKIELATAAETTTGTDAVRAVTPATLKIELDKKAVTGHGHALTDANITGVLPIAQVPTGTSGTTVALGNHTHVAANITDFATAADARVNAVVVAASETVQGKVELATLAEVATGTDTARAVTPAGVAQQIATRAATSHTHTASQVTDFSSAADARVNSLVPAASTSAAGKVELATDAEAIAGSSALLAVTPASLLAVVGNSATNFVTAFEAGLV